MWFRTKLYFHLFFCTYIRSPLWNPFQKCVWAEWGISCGFCSRVCVLNTPACIVGSFFANLWLDDGLFVFIPRSWVLLVIQMMQPTPMVPLYPDWINVQRLEDAWSVRQHLRFSYLIVDFFKFIFILTLTAHLWRGWWTELLWAVEFHQHWRGTNGQRLVIAYC